MNGKKAKLLRGLAGVQKGESADRLYEGTNVKNKVMLNSLGQVAVRYQTATYVLSDSSRKLYKLLKKNYFPSINLVFREGELQSC